MENDGFRELNSENLLSCAKRLYGFDDNTRMELLKYSENLTYELWNEKNGERYVLRVFRPGYHKAEEMSGELTWVHRLTQDTDIMTADVLPGLDGKFVQNANGFYIAVFEFVEGNELTEITGQELYFYMEKIGEIAGKLHRHAMVWPGSKNLIRFSWDLKDIIEPNGRWGHYSRKKDLPPEYMHCYDDATKIIRYRLERFGRGKDRYGLIHSDLNIHNLLVKDNEIYVLDFDDCGYGWFLYDFSTIVLEYFDDVMDGTLEALVRGYERIRPLSQEEKEEIPTFVAARKILRIGWIADHSDNDTVKQIPSDYYEKTFFLAERYCRENEKILKLL